MNDPATGRRPRVLHFITHLALGGAERIALDLVRGLRGEFDPAVFTVHCGDADSVGHAMRQELAATTTPLFSGTRVPFKFGGMVLAGWHAARAVDAFQPDLIHLHTEIPEAAYAAMVTLRAALARIPVVRTIHNSVYWGYWPRLGRWCDRRMARAHIAGVSQGAVAAFARLRAALAASAPPSPPVVIFNGVESPPRSRPPDQAPRAQLRLLFAGRFEFQKGADLLPEILARVHPPSGCTCELTSHGSGAHEAMLRALSAHPPAGWTVNVRAPIAGLAAAMSEFDLVLMPSRFEGLGLVAVEALLAGVPVIATDAPGLREALPPDYPWRAAPGDAASFAAQLQRALEEPARWPAAVAQGRRFARERFDPARMLAAYRALYARALS